MSHSRVGAKGDGEDDMPLVDVETGNGGSLYCRTTSCVEDPQSSAMDYLLSNNLRQLSDLLSDDKVDTEKQYPDHGHKTLLHVAVEQANTEAVKMLVAGGAKVEHYNTILKQTVLHAAATKGDNNMLTMLLQCCGDRAGYIVNMKDRAGRTALFAASTVRE